MALVWLTPSRSEASHFVQRSSELRGLRGQMEDKGYSCSDNDAKLVNAWLASRPRPKTDRFTELAAKLDDPMLAEMIWVFYGKDSIRIINSPLKAINADVPWWRFRRKNTILSLMKTREGRRRVWQMLHDASAWM